MTSHASSVSSTPIQVDSPRTEFTSAQSGDQPQKRASSMVEQDQPSIQPRPSPGMAHEVDRQSFNQRWEAEQREARKAAFIQMRTDLETGGQVRSLSKAFKR